MLAPLMLLVMAPIAVNILIFHATLAPGGIAPGLILTVLLVLTMLRYKSKYDPLLKPN